MRSLCCLPRAINTSVVDDWVAQNGSWTAAVHRKSLENHKPSLQSTRHTPWATSLLSTKAMSIPTPRKDVAIRAVGPKPSTRIECEISQLGNSAYQKDGELARRFKEIQSSSLPISSEALVPRRCPRHCIAEVATTAERMLTHEYPVRLQCCENREGQQHRPPLRLRRPETALGSGTDLREATIWKAMPLLRQF